MPMPWAIRHATKDWQAFLADAKGRLDLDSDNSAYTAVDAVLLVFRRRLSVAEAVAFAQLLPACLRALFVQDWDVTAPRLPFTTRDAMTREAKEVRKHHNLTPDRGGGLGAAPPRPPARPRQPTATPAGGCGGFLVRRNRRPPRARPPDHLSRRADFAGLGRFPPRLADGAGR